MSSLILGDCIEKMKELGDNSIDAIVTDPPYLYLNHKLDRNFDEEVFFQQARRVLKPGGFIVLFGRGTSFYRWNTVLTTLDFTFKEEVVWNKLIGGSPLLALSRVHETISIFSKGKAKITKTKIPYIENRKFDITSVINDVKKLRVILNNPKSLQKVQDFLEHNKQNYDSVHAYRHGINTPNSLGDTDRAAVVMNSMQNGMTEKSIINIPSDHYKTIHPTQKPVRLIERLIALVSSEGGVILDPFAGSGSTAVACININREYLCYEIDEEYFKLAEERIEQHVSQGVLL